MNIVPHFRRLLVTVLLLLGAWLAAADTPRAKYVFLLIGDGMGQNSVRLYREQVPNSNFGQLGDPVVTGTNNIKGTVTDSAASGTALACGIKTVNGAVGVDENGAPVPSLARLLKQRGVRIGIISSVGINDATPGAHYANRQLRKEYSGVLSDLFASGFDFFGASSLLRPDDFTDKDLALMLKRNRYELLQGPDGLKKLKPGTPGFFFGLTEISDRKGYLVPAPSLAEVTAAAITVLDNPKGFFLMVEGGAIDHGNHSNDSGTMIREMQAFDQVIGTALDFARKHPQETLVVVTADHTTGGIEFLDDGKREIGFWQHQTLPYGTLANRLSDRVKAGDNASQLIESACQVTGIAVPAADSPEYAELQKAAELTLAGKTTGRDKMTDYGRYNPLVITAFHLRDRQNGFRYTTYGHTDKPVWSYVCGVGAPLFTVPLENSDIPHRISMAMTGEDLLQKYAGMPPFPSAEVTAHLQMQSLGCDFFRCRYTQTKSNTIIFSLQGGGKTSVQEFGSPFGRVEFTGLIPDTEYVLTVTGLLAQPQVTHFRTLSKPQGAPLLRGAVLADPHTSNWPDNPKVRLHSRGAEILTSIRQELEKQQADVMLVPGDLTDSSKPAELKSFLSVFQKAPFRIIATCGNHDRLQGSFGAAWQQAFGPPAGIEECGGLQILRLDTGNGKLNNPGNAEALDKLDPGRPALIITHYQLQKDTHITDSDAAIKDADTPESRAMLEKIIASRAIVLVGHKNLAARTLIGGRIVQLNCPQTTQYPNGYLVFAAYPDGLRFHYQPSSNAFLEEYSRRLGNAEAREKYAFEYWNGFLPWPEKKSQ